jgi:hypothetical protein
MSSFGTPSASAIANSFLSGDAQVDPFVNQVQQDKITNLQNELFMVEKERTMEEKRTKENIARIKELRATSRKAKLVYSKVEDLNVEELSELLHDLSRVKQEINNDQLLPPQQPSNQQLSNQLEVGGSKGPLLQWLSSSPSHSKNPLPPRRLPWAHIQPSLHVAKSSLSLPLPSWSQATLLNQTILPTAQAPSTSLLQHGLMPQHPLMFNTQAQILSSSNEAHQHNYNNTQGVHINSNILQPYPQSSLISMLQPPPSSSAQITFCNELPPPSLLQQPPTLLPPEPELHPTAQPENHASSGDFTADHPIFSIDQWPSPIQSDGPFFDAFMD